MSHGNRQFAAATAAAAGRKPSTMDSKQSHDANSTPSGVTVDAPLPSASEDAGPRSPLMSAPTADENSDQDTVAKAPIDPSQNGVSAGPASEHAPATHAVASVASKKRKADAPAEIAAHTKSLLSESKLLDLKRERAEASHQRDMKRSQTIAAEKAAWIARNEVDREAAEFEELKRQFHRPPVPATSIPVRPTAARKSSASAPSNRDRDSKSKSKSPQSGTGTRAKQPSARPAPPPSTLATAASMSSSAAGGEYEDDAAFDGSEFGVENDDSLNDLDMEDDAADASALGPSTSTELIDVRASRILHSVQGSYNNKRPFTPDQIRLSYQDMMKEIKSFGHYVGFQWKHDGSRLRFAEDSKKALVMRDCDLFISEYIKLKQTLYRHGFDTESSLQSDGDRTLSAIQLGIDLRAVYQLPVSRAENLALVQEKAKLLHSIKSNAAAVAGTNRTSSRKPRNPNTARHGSGGQRHHSGGGSGDTNANGNGTPFTSNSHNPVINTTTRGTRGRGRGRGNYGSATSAAGGNASS